MNLKQLFAELQEAQRAPDGRLVLAYQADPETLTYLESDAKTTIACLKTFAKEQAFCPQCHPEMCRTTERRTP